MKIFKPHTIIRYKGLVSMVSESGTEAYNPHMPLELIDGDEVSEVLWDEDDEPRPRYAVDEDVLVVKGEDSHFVQSLSGRSFDRELVGLLPGITRALKACAKVDMPVTFNVEAGERVVILERIRRYATELTEHPDDAASRANMLFWLEKGMRHE